MVAVGTPFLGHIAPPGALPAPGLSVLAGKQLGPRGSVVSKTCFGEQSVKCKLNRWPGRRGSEVTWLAEGDRRADRLHWAKVAQEGGDPGG